MVEKRFTHKPVGKVVTSTPDDPTERVQETFNRAERRVQAALDKAARKAARKAVAIRAATAVREGR